MQDNQQLIKSSKQGLSISENQEVTKEIAKAYKRTMGLVQGSTDANSLMSYFKTISEDIESIVSKTIHGRKITPEQVTEAILHGSTGKYGVSYKFTGMIVCHWIREYLKVLPPRAKREEEKKYDIMDNAIRDRMSFGEDREEAINQYFSKKEAEMLHGDLFDDNHYLDRPLVHLQGSPVHRMQYYQKISREKFINAKSEFLGMDEKYNTDKQE